MASSLPVSPRGVPSCLGVPPTLVRVTAQGWEELSLLLRHAEASERQRIEEAAHVVADGLRAAARRQWRQDASDYVTQGPRRLSHVDGHRIENATTTTTIATCASSAQLLHAAAGQSPCSPSSPSSSALRTPRRSTTSPPSLTPFQRFCFTKSTLNAYVEDHRSCFGATGTARAVRRTSALHAQRLQDAKADTCAAAVAQAPLEPSAAAVFAAASPPYKRDVWSWSNTRSREIRAPETVPTLARSYGSAARRAVSMEILFDRLSYEGKAQVARHAASLGLLPPPPSPPPSFSRAASLQLAATSECTSPRSKMLISDTDATVLTGALDDTACVDSGEGFVSGMGAAKHLFSPVPAAPLS